MFQMGFRRTVLLLILLSHDSSRGTPGDEFWDDRFDALGVEGEVWAIVVIGNDTYVGGQFTKAGRVDVANIARWDGRNWWALGSGVDRAGVRTLAVSGTNLYVGGFFNQAGDTAASWIARWDGSKWSDFGGGVNGSVRSLLVTGGDLYVGGSFSYAVGNAGGVVASNVARWNGGNWAALDDGVGQVISSIGGNYVDLASVFALATDGNEVYVGGRFLKAGGLNVTNLARWNGTKWGTLRHSSEIIGGVQALAIHGGLLYVGGFFWTDAHGGQTNFAAWNGVNWLSPGGGLGGQQRGTVNSLAVAEDGVFVGGAGFEKLQSRNLVKWNGVEWEGLGSGLTAGGEVNALAVKGNQLFVGGRFGVAGGKPARNFSIWHIAEKLRIQRSPNAVELSWPVSLSNVVLEASAQLASTNWTAVGKSPALQDGQLSIADQISAPQQFYRLRKKP